MRLRYLTPLLLALILHAPASFAQMDEASVKAAYIYNFLHFTEWPTPPNQPFSLCIAGNTPLDQQLELLNNKSIRDNVVIVVTHISLSDTFSSCNALYIGTYNPKYIDRLLRKLDSAPILTISDGAGLGDRGIMIEMVARNNKITFDVNLKAAQIANMNFSSRLLKLANFIAMR